MQFAEKSDILSEITKEGLFAKTAHFLPYLPCMKRSFTPSFYLNILCYNLFGIAVTFRDPSALYEAMVKH